MTIFQNQGWRQLFAGLSINYIKVLYMFTSLSFHLCVVSIISLQKSVYFCFQIVPSVAIGFTAYDMMKAWLRVPPRQKSKAISAAA